MRRNRLQLNTNTTDRPFVERDQLPTTATRIGSEYVVPSSSVRDLGIFIDSDLSMKTRVQRTAPVCATVSTHVGLPSDTDRRLASVVAAGLYENVTMAGLLERPQSVLNAAARSNTTTSL